MMNPEPLISASTLVTGALAVLCIMAVAAFFLYYYLAQWAADGMEREFQPPLPGRSRY